MAKKKKLNTIQIIGLVIIVIAAGLLIIGSMTGGMVKKAVESAGSNALKVPVTLGGAELQILAGKVKLDDLVIANPEGYQNPTMLEAGKIFVDADLMSFTGDKARIEKIELDKITVTVEQKQLSNNIKDIMNNLPKKDKPEPEPDQPKDEKKVQVDELVISNTKVRVKLLPLPGKSDTVEFSLPTITMNDIGKDEDVSIKDLAAKLVAKISSAIATHGAGQLPGEMVKAISGSVSEYGSAFLKTGTDVMQKGMDTGVEAGKKALEGAGDIGKGAGDVGKDAMEKTGDAIKGMFGGSKD